MTLRKWKLKEKVLDRALCKTRNVRVRDYRMMMMRMDTWPTGENKMNNGNFLSVKHLHIRTVDASVYG